MAHSPRVKPPVQSQYARTRRVLTSPVVRCPMKKKVDLTKLINADFLVQSLGHISRMLSCVRDRHIDRP